jgi:hypothetical protein
LFFKPSHVLVFSSLQRHAILSQLNDLLERNGGFSSAYRNAFIVCKKNIPDVLFGGLEDHYSKELSRDVFGRMYKVSLLYSIALLFQPRECQLLLNFP